MNTHFPSMTLSVHLRTGGDPLTIKVVEVGLRTLVECIERTDYNFLIATAAVRLPDASGDLVLRAHPRWLDEITDDSLLAVMAASKALNLTVVRAKNALSLAQDTLDLQTAISTEPGLDSARSSLPAATTPA